MRTNVIKWRMAAAVAMGAQMAVVAGATAATAPASNQADGPRSLLITYRAAAADRPAFRHYLAHVELARLAAEHEPRPSTSDEADARMKR